MWPLLAWIAGTLGSAAISEQRDHTYRSLYRELSLREKGLALREALDFLGQRPLRPDEPNLREIFELTETLYVVAIGDSEHYVISVTNDLREARADFNHAVDSEGRHVFLWEAPNVPFFIAAPLLDRSYADGYDAMDRVQEYLEEEPLEKYDYTDHPFEEWPGDEQGSHRESVLYDVERKTIPKGAKLYLADAEGDIDPEDLDPEYSSTFLLTNDYEVAVGLARDHAAFMSRVRSRLGTGEPVVPRILVFEAPEDLTVLAPEKSEDEWPNEKELAMVLGFDLDDISVSGVEDWGPKVERLANQKLLDLDNGIGLEAFGPKKFAIVLFDTSLDFVEEVILDPLLEDPGES